MREERTRNRRWTRRQCIRAATSAGLMVGLAGCQGDGEDGDGTPTPDEDGADGGDDSSMATDTPGDGDDSTDSEDGGEPLREELKVWMTEAPEMLNMNPWAADPFSAEATVWFTELVDARHEVQGGLYTGGHSWSFSPIKGPDREFEVPMLAKDYEINPPTEYTFEMDDRFTYWDGTTIDAEAVELHNRVGFMSTGAHLDGEEFTNGVATDDFTVEFETDSERSELDLQRTITLGVSETVAPYHPSFTRPWVERFEDASSQDTIDDLASELAEVNHGLTKWYEEGYGSGPYEITTDNEIGEEEVIAHLREDHPRADNISIPDIRIQIAADDRLQLLQERGDIDVWHGIISAEGRGHAYRRGALQDYSQSSDRFLTEGGAQVMFNWDNKHLERLNVRRAIVAAGDWLQIQTNWAGEHNIPTQFDTGLADTADQRWFEQDFLDQLYDWPARADTDQATEFLQEAGYSRKSGQWIGPDGDVLELNFTNATIDEGWILGAETLKRNLEEVDVSIQVNNLEVSSWQSRLDSGEWTMSWLWHSGGHPLEAYDSDGNWFVGSFIDGVGSNTHAWNASEEERAQNDNLDNANRPLEQTIPEEVGALEVQGSGETVDLPKLFLEMRSPGTSEEEIRELSKTAARWYNYTVPDFFFKQDQWSVIRNVRDFSWPQDDHESYPIQWGLGEYQAMAGMASTTSDDSYPDPEDV